MNSEHLSIPSDDLTVGEKLQGQMARSKLYLDQERKELEKRRDLERIKFALIFENRLKSHKFQTKMNKKILKNKKEFEVVRELNKYLCSHDLVLLDRLNEIAQEQHVNIKLVNIYKYQIDDLVTWMAHPTKKPSVYRSQSDKHPNGDKGYKIYNVKKDKLGDSKIYGIVVFVYI